MWDSKESVYNIITKPALKKARTPPKAPDKALVRYSPCSDLLLHLCTR